MQRSISGQSDHSQRTGVHLLLLQLPLGTPQDALQWAPGIVTPENTLIFQGAGWGSARKHRNRLTDAFPASASLLVHGRWGAGYQASENLDSFQTVLVSQALSTAFPEGSHETSSSRVLPAGECFTGTLHQALFLEMSEHPLASEIHLP